MAKSLGSFVRMLEEKHPGRLLRVMEELDPNRHEISSFIKLLEEKGQDQVVLFERVLNVKGAPSKFPLLHNCFATRSLCALAIDEDPADSRMGLSIRFGEIEKTPGSVTVLPKTEAPVLQNIWTGAQADVTLLPAARYHEKDVGSYFTMACLMKSRSNGFYDVSPTKNLIHDPQRLSLSAHGHHHLARIVAEYEAAKEPAPVAIVLGHHPAFYLGSCVLAPWGNDDYATIGAFLREPLRLTPSASLGDDFLIPADAEIIVEGIVQPGIREYQNPFGENSGHYQNRMLVPVVEVKAICFRDNAIMQGLIPGHAEVIILGGIPKEGSVFHAIKKVVPEVTAVHLPHSGMGRFNAFISLDKRTSRDVTVSAMIAFAEMPNLKLAIMVDSEVDVFNEREVMWAATTQTRWDRDVTVIPRVQSFRGWLGDAVCIIDATRHEEVAGFPERNRIPEEAVKRLRELGF